MNADVSVGNVSVCLVNQITMLTNLAHCGRKRRIGLNTSAKYLLGGLALWAAQTSSAAVAGSQSIAIQAVLSASSVGQAQSATKQADELLKQARKEIETGNLEQADVLIGKAEKLNPQYNAFYLGDTPKKAREDLKKKLVARSTPSRSGFGLFGSKEQPKDPFAARRSENAAPAPANTAAREDSPAAGKQTSVIEIEPQRGSAYGSASLRIAAGPEQKAPPANVGSAYGPPPSATQTNALAANGGSQSEARILSPQSNSVGPIAQGSRPGEASISFRGRPENVPPANPSHKPQPPANAKDRAVELARQARSALVRGDLDSAQRLANDAQRVGVPDSAFGPGDERPGLVLLDIMQARTRGGVVQASGIAQERGVIQAGGPNAPNAGGVVRSVYDPNNDKSRNVPVRGNEPAGPNLGTLAQATNGNGAQRGGEPEPIERPAPGASPNTSAAMRLFQQGLQAAQNRDHRQAQEYFRQAYQLRNELDPATVNRLEMHLQMLSQPVAGPREAQSPRNYLEGASANQQVLVRQVAADVSKTQTQAKAMLGSEPKKALEMLQTMRHNVEIVPQLDENARRSMMANLERSITEAQQFIKQNAAQIELNEQNQAVESAVEKKQEKRIEIDEKLAALVEEFNRLVDEQRYAEAEVVAKKAREMDPENLVVVNLMRMSKVLARTAAQRDIYERKEDGFIASLNAVEEASVASAVDFQMPNMRDWKDLTKRREELSATDNNLRSPRERQIEQALKTQVLLKYNQRPLTEVLNDLAKLANISIYLDPQGMAAEGVTTDTPVSINLSNEVSLKSALLLILEPLRMNYVIANDVLKVTSSELTVGKVYTKSYPVADLIIPIPNFVPDGREGINAALEQGYRRAGYGGPIGFGVGGAPTVVVADAGRATPVNPVAQAQFFDRPNSPPVSGVPQAINFGPGGLGGGSQADFDPLIDLITATIAPQTWDTVGGPGSIQPFETNLTLVVSQTQEVHEQIADLLQQLRRLQDLQVTIEVRFINLSDNFFERIGIDFDFNIDDNFTGPFVPINSDQGPSAVIGLDPAIPLTPTANLDLQFRQGSFQATVPNIPGVGFDPAAAGTFGFAILSDIEAFFVIQAAQGDTRSNILQAPKVTLFNGQTAFISDTSQRPFVTSIIPVVGDFAAAQQPVIVVLSEGTQLSVQGVVSSDRRFVRLTIVPFFSTIGNVEEFTFTGSKTTKTTSSSSSAKKGDDEDENSKESDTEVSEEGTTVQLPTFSFVTVTTTVSVPDGGTVLLGGIKRMNEGRIERGLPILSKLPYINRLFKNVGIGRTTQSLMLMVTPRIIIQEEEEEKLIGTSVP
jgi:general secretion pathway protein D